MPGMTPLSPDSIGKAAGFPTAPGQLPVQGVSSIPAQLQAPMPVAPMKAGPSSGTTEIVPGMTDWLRNLVVSMLPVPAAAAAPKATPNTDPGSLGRVNGALPPGQAPRLPAIDLGAFWQRPPVNYSGGVRG